MRQKDGFVTARTNHCGYIFENRKPCSAFNQGVGVIQVDKDRCVIERSAGGPTLQIEVGIKIEGLVVDSRHLVIWSGREIKIFRLFDESVELRSEIPCRAKY
eukprot:1991621-Ditylum_brightwellii.AAC.1